MAEIQPLFLTAENSSRLMNSTVGNEISAAGYEHLWSERTSAVDTVVFHFMSDRFRSPEDPYNPEKLISIFCEFEVSAHYLILRDGQVLHLVPEEYKAWHAGGSIMPEPDNRIGVNDFSIGIELAGSELEPFTQEQYRSLQELTSSIGSRHRITSIVGHEDIAGTRAVEMELRTDEKPDPGPQFEWHRFSDFPILHQ